MSDISLALFLKLCAGRTVHDSIGDTYLSPAGQPYVAVCGVGDASMAESAFNEYAKGRSGCIYWRVLPELTAEGYYMRLFMAPS